MRVNVNGTWCPDLHSDGSVISACLGSPAQVHITRLDVDQKAECYNDDVTYSGAARTYIEDEETHWRMRRMKM